MGDAADCFVECFLHFLGHLIARLLIVSVMLFIDRHVVERRDLIVQTGRKIQSRLCIPQCLRIFADNEPGIFENHLRNASFALFYAGVMANLGLLLAFTPDKQNAYVANTSLFMVAIPVSIMVVVWIVLSCCRRRLERLPRLPPPTCRYYTSGYGGCIKKEQDEKKQEEESRAGRVESERSTFASINRSLPIDFPLWP